MVGEINVTGRSGSGVVASVDGETCGGGVTDFLSNFLEDITFDTASKVTLLIGLTIGTMVFGRAILSTVMVGEMNVTGRSGSGVVASVDGELCGGGVADFLSDFLEDITFDTNSDLNT
jgi:hypothetical protein